MNVSFSQLPTIESVHMAVRYATETSRQPCPGAGRDIVTTVLPSARHDLGFSNPARHWIVTAHFSGSGASYFSVAGCRTCPACAGIPEVLYGPRLSAIAIQYPPNSRAV
jgi:hypothetical protein